MRVGLLKLMTGGVRCVSMWGHLEGVLHGLRVLQLHHVQDVVGDVAGLPTSVPQLPPLLVILYHLERQH